MRDRLLSAALAGNAAFSAASGIVLLLAPDSVGDWLGVRQSGLLMSTGGALLGFAGVATSQALRRTRVPLGPLLISLADLAWVIGTALVLLVVGGSFSGLGVAVLLLVAATVAGFALAQLLGIARSYQAPAAAGGSHRVCVEVATAVTAEALWEAVGDLGGIARFVPTLAESRLRDDAVPAAGAVRECRDVSGRAWAERCTLYDPAEHRLEVEFLSDEPGFPYPFRAMTGGWSVEQRALGAVVRVWWHVTPKRPRFASVILPLMDYTVRRSFPDAIAQMAAAGGGHGADAPAAAGTRSRLAAIGC